MEVRAVTDYLQGERAECFVIVSHYDRKGLLKTAIRDDNPVIF